MPKEYAFPLSWKPSPSDLWHGVQMQTLQLLQKGINGSSSFFDILR